MKRFWGHLLVAVLAAVALLSWPRDVRAEDTVAAALFARAERAFAENQFEKAARLFEDADAKAPHASVVYNAAVSWDHAGRPARAAGAYQLALQREGLTQDQSTNAETRLDALAKDLGYVQVTRPVGGLVTVAHILRTPIPIGFYLEPGSYAVLIQTTLGVETTQTITVVRNQSTRVEGALIAPTPAPLTQPPPPKPAPAPDRTQEILGWAGLGAGVIASGIAVYFGLTAISERDRFARSANTDAQARDAAASRRFGANVAWGSAAGFGVLGAGLLIASPSFEF